MPQLGLFERFILGLLPPAVRAIVEAAYAAMAAAQPGVTVPLPSAFWDIRGVRFRHDHQITRLP